jgi:hypothetical protein
LLKGMPNTHILASARLIWEPAKSGARGGV